MNDKVIECEGFTFLANFDSANLARVEFVPRKVAVQATPSETKTKKIPSSNAKPAPLPRKSKPLEFPDYEFNLWTNPDCAGTEFENCNRTWFHFGITGGTVYSLVKLNIIDLNKQSKMYNQGMAPVFRVLPGKCQWERVHDKPIFTSQDNIFTLSFKFRTTDNVRAVTYFAFTYPYSYSELQSFLSSVDLKMSNQGNHTPKPEIKFNKGLKISNDINDTIYYHRELLCYSLEKRNVDLITISSHHNITSEREPRLQGLFPQENVPRPFKFQDKKVVFISARVHPGETPSSFVMNGILTLLIQKDNPIAILLRRQFVFKLIPMLNPDGVALGHYRTDTRGCNLNRYYLNPSPEYHPSIFAARSLICYHHFGEEKDDDINLGKFDVSSQADPNEISESELSSPDTYQGVDSSKPNDSLCNFSAASLIEKTLVNLNKTSENAITPRTLSSASVSVKMASAETSCESLVKKDVFFTLSNSEDEMAKGEMKKTKSEAESNRKTTGKQKQKDDSGLFLYLDMHGHASKKGVFMYGNHFEKIEESVECMLFPKIMSVNSQNFHFSACNFTEKNMYLRDKRDGTSREGSGRVAVYRLTGLIRSYTLECNYNTGRFVNKLPQCCRELPGKSNSNLIVPPKYSPAVYEEIGRSICISILDMTNSNPWSRIPNSEYHTLYGIRDWLRVKNISDNFLYHKPVSKSLLRSKPPSKSSQTQVMIGVLRSDVRPGKLISNVLLAPIHSKQSVIGEHNQDEMERKDNVSGFRGAGNAMMVNRKEAGPSHPKRVSGRVSSVIQVRGGGSRPMKSLKKTIYRGGDKLPKFKQYIQKTEGNTEETGSSETDNKSAEGERRLKKTTVSDQCFFKQSPKRLKMSKGDEGTKSKVSDWSKEDAIPGPSCSDMLLYSKLNRPGSGGDGPGMKRTKTKVKQQMPSPLKFKKCLEKRRGSDASRKKSKTLFKKAGKIILTNDTNKNLVDRKRRKN